MGKYFPPYGLVVQLVRTLACHARGRGFEPHPGRQLLRKGKRNAFVAQSVEQRTENPRVVGSIPTEGTRQEGEKRLPAQCAGLAHLVERHLAKVEVASSNLVTRSNTKSLATMRFAGLFSLARQRSFYVNIVLF